MPFIRSLLFLTGSLTPLTGCQSGGSEKTADPVIRLAVLETVTPENIAALRTQIGVALGRSDPEFGPGDLSATGMIAVLPPRLSDREGNSPVLPEIFDLLLSGDICVARSRTTGEEITLTGLPCVPAAPTDN